MSPFHMASYVFIGGGFWLISVAWPRLLKAVKENALATAGPYRHIRHPQYAGFLLILIGFLLQWPTLPTIVMFPILVVVYRRLALQEEREVAGRFPEEWLAYSAHTPRFIPSRRRQHRSAGVVHDSGPGAPSGSGDGPSAPPRSGRERGVRARASR